MRIKLFSYLTIDYKAGEAMLNRTADKGWELKRLFLGLFAIFKRTERTDLRYFVDFGDSVYRENPEYLTLCADAGWVSVGYTRSMNLYASAPGTTPVPLQTDSALEYERFRKLVLKRVRTSGLVYAALGLALALLVPFGIFNSFIANLCQWTSFRYSFALLLFSLPGVLVCGGIYMALLLSRVRQWRVLTETGEPIPVPEPRSAMGHGILTLLGGIYAVLFALSYLLDLVINDGFSGNWGVVLILVVGPITAITLYIAKEYFPQRRTSPAFVVFIICGGALLLILNVFSPITHLFQPVLELPTVPILADKALREDSYGSWVGRIDRWAEIPDGEGVAGLLRVSVYTCRFDWMADSLEVGCDSSTPYTLLLRRGNSVALVEYPEDMPLDELLAYIDHWQKTK